MIGYRERNVAGTEQERSRNETGKRRDRMSLAEVTLRSEERRVGKECAA